MAPDKDIMYNQSNKAALEFAKHAIQFAFLLNGAAATALFTKVDKGYENAAIFFCLGAICAVFVMAGAYIVQILICETWRQDNDPISVFFFRKWRSLSIKYIEDMRLCCMCLWLISMVCSIVGAVLAAAV